MAITLEGSYTVPAPKAQVWASLNDPAALKACISGCQSFERTSETTFTATARIKIGPLGATFRCLIELRDVDAPNGCRILATGEGGLAGFAKGTADVRLEDAPSGTLVIYAVEADVGGRIAQFGSRWIGGIGTKVADKFFTAFTAQVLAAAPSPG